MPDRVPGILRRQSKSPSNKQRNKCQLSCSHPCTRVDINVQKMRISLGKNKKKKAIGNKSFEHQLLVRIGLEQLNTLGKKEIKTQTGTTCAVVLSVPPVSELCLLSLVCKTSKPNKLPFPRLTFSSCLG